jgi:hypothetical protein
LEINSGSKIYFMKTQAIKALTTFFLLVTINVSFGQIAPNLKSVGDFAILAATKICFDGGSTTINTLDVGLSPGFQSQITGSVIMNGGAIYAADDMAPVPAMLAQAKLDLQVAYLFAQSALLPAPATVSGNQGGLT